MAEGNGEEENPFSFRSYNRKKESSSNEEGESSENSTVHPDLGIGDMQHDTEKRIVIDSFATSSEPPKREENPFSFKHFLKRDITNNYQSTGARPKVYSNVTPEHVDHNESETELESGIYGRSATPRHVGTPELTSVLPDFVQDHLVVEQCYLNHSDNSSPQLTVDLENLPDFAINNISPAEESLGCNKSSSKSRLWDEPKSVGNEPKDIPFDLTGSTRSQNFSGRVRNSNATVPLDLPIGESSSVPAPRPNGGLPLDLPYVQEVSGAPSPAVTPSSRNGSPLGEVGVSKSLPDFLSDGPIHSGRHNDEPADSISICNNSTSQLQSSEEHIQRLQIENDHLRRELEVSRRQLSDQARRIQFLEKELCAMQSKEHEETANLEKAIEQVEDNLKRSTRRAVLAENQVSKLKQETKMLHSELAQLRRENRALRLGQGAGLHLASAGASGGASEPSQQLVQRLAQDLHAAAGTAEVSLRQLLTGVENLRVIAATMESMHRIQDQTSDFLTDMEPDHRSMDGAGPAL